MLGNYSNKIDDKSRISIPSTFRARLSETIVLSIGIDNILELRTKEEFKSWTSSLQGKGELLKDSRNLQRAILGNSYELTLDKQGRIVIPSSLIKYASIVKEVQIVGVGNRLEIHSVENWDKFIGSVSTNLSKIAETLNDK